MNEPDAFALEAGLRLKEKLGGEVVAVSAGPARAGLGDSWRRWRKAPTVES